MIHNIKISADGSPQITITVDPPDHGALFRIVGWAKELLGHRIAEVAYNGTEPLIILELAQTGDMAWAVGEAQSLLAGAVRGWLAQLNAPSPREVLQQMIDDPQPSPPGTLVIPAGSGWGDPDEVRAILEANSMKVPPKED